MVKYNHSYLILLAMPEKKAIWLTKQSVIAATNQGFDGLCRMKHTWVGSLFVNHRGIIGLKTARLVEMHLRQIQKYACILLSSKNDVILKKNVVSNVQRYWTACTDTSPKTHVGDLMQWNVFPKGYTNTLPWHTHAHNHPWSKTMALPIVFCLLY